MLTRLLGKLECWTERNGERLFRVGVLVVALLAIYMRTLHVADVAIRSPDERVYTHFAERIAAEGLSAYGPLFERYVSDSTEWLYPSPARIVHVLLFAGVMKLTGSGSEQAGAAVSWALGIGSVLLLARLGRRFMSPLVAVLAAFFMATWVVELEFARRAWGESTASFLVVVLMYAACSLHAQPASWRWRIAFFAAGTACLLCKETSAVAYALCGLWLVVTRLIQVRDYPGAALWSLSGLLSAGAAFAVVALLAGDVGSAYASLAPGLGLGSVAGAAENASEPWYGFVDVLWSMAPVTASMAAVGVVAVALRRPFGRVFQALEPGARAPVSLALLLALSFAGAGAFGPNLQYLYLLAPASAGYCLLAALGLRLVLLESEGWLRGRAYPIVIALLPVLLAVSSTRDYRLYRDVVVQSGMQDLAVRWISDGMRARDRELDRTQHALRTAATESATNGAAGTPTTPDASPPAAPVALETSASLLDRSVRHCQRNEFAECVRLAQAVLQNDPRLPEAWNNAAVGYGGLRLWDDAIRCAEAALKLRPDFQLAKNNLAWVSDEKAKHTLVLEH